MSIMNYASANIPIEDVLKAIKKAHKSNVKTHDTISITFNLDDQELMFQKITAKQNLIVYVPLDKSAFSGCIVEHNNSLYYFDFYLDNNKKLESDLQAIYKMDKDFGLLEVYHFNSTMFTSRSEFEESDSVIAETCKIVGAPAQIKVSDLSLGNLRTETDHFGEGLKRNFYPFWTTFQKIHEMETEKSKKYFWLTYYGR